MRIVRLQLIALLAAVAVLSSNGASARTQYLCRITRVLLADRCCTAEGPARFAHAAQQARSADCCERVLTAARAGAPGTRDESRSTAGMAVLAVPPLPAYTPRTAAALVAVAVRSRRAPLAVGPPLFVAHCAFLI